MESREAILKKAYELGFRYEQEYKGCCQCTLAAIQDTLNLGNSAGFDAVFKAGTGLAAGICLTGSGACGSLTGGVMAIGYHFGRERSGFTSPGTAMFKTQGLGLKLFNKFIEAYGSGNCKDIQKKIFGRSFNLLDRSEWEAFDNAGAHIDKCPSVVGNATRWTVEILLEQRETIQDTI
jgi:C_GCAxxG_C_C family probable redox protein